MVELNLSVRYNRHDAEAEGFANEFIADLQRCLMRFAVKASISVNPNEDEHQRTVLILSHSDNIPNDANPWYTPYIKGSQNLVLILSPLENSIIDNLKLSTVHVFWERVFETGEIRKIRRSVAEAQYRYWEKVADVCLDMIADNQASTKESLAQKVYLSHGDVYVNADRENLKRDLNDLGFKVLPDKPFSTSIDECTNQIKTFLHEVELIVNIIPPIYNPFFVNQHLSLAEHQCNITAEYIKQNPNVQRIIWLPTSFEVTDEENQVFIEKLQRDPDQVAGTVVLKSPIEELKKIYRKFLLSAKADNVAKAEQVDLYVVSDPNHSEAINEIINSVKIGSGANVMATRPDVSYKSHIGCLAQCKNVILFYNVLNETWLKTKISEIEKSKGLDAYSPFNCIILFVHNSLPLPSGYQNVFTHIVSSINELSAIDLSET